MSTAATVQHFFDAEAPEYGAKHYRPGANTFIGIRQERILELVDALPLRLGEPVLDAGCGPGLLSVELARRGFAVQSLDFSAQMLAAAARNGSEVAAACRPALVQGDVQRLPYRSESFAAVCSAGVIEYLPGDEAVLREFARVLRPDGYLVVSTTRAGAPLHLLEPVIEALKRRPAVTRGLSRWRARRGEPPVVPRHFKVRMHRPAEFRERLSAAGFEVVADRYFCFSLWPHPAERVLPRISAHTEARLARSPSRLARGLAAGYIALARRHA